MMEGTLSKAAESMHGELHGIDVSFRGVSTDTRTIESGELFVALSGPNFDGTKFVSAAAARDAAAAVVDHNVQSDLPSIKVEDTRKALGELALAWRQKMPTTVVGITGSNGKTTLKEMTASCLSQAAKTLATEGNLNNHIGVPLTLLRLSEDDQFGVIEMGANHAGEIAYLASLAHPHVVAITNAGPAHLEGFGSIKGVAHAKGELLQVEPRPRVAVLNADDDYFELWQSFAADIDILSFGLGDQAAVRGMNIEASESGSRFDLQTPAGTRSVEIGLAGLHNVRNACAAAAISLAVDVSLDDIVAGLAIAAPVSGRLHPLAGLNGSTIYDDSYNANPASVAAGAEFLAALPGDSILVLADMGELGDDAAELHRGVGDAVREAGVDRFMATGELCRHAAEAYGEGATWFADVDSLIDALRGELGAETSVLVKGSRSMHMGRVVRAIESAQDEAKAG